MEPDTEIVSVKIDEKVTLLVEATALGGEEDVGIGDILDFQEVTDAIEAIANSLTKTFDKVKPKKAGVEFGLEVGIESGKLSAMLVKGSGKANFKITLEYEK